jgi:hypothetical protein
MFFCQALAFLHAARIMICRGEGLQGDDKNGLLLAGRRFGWGDSTQPPTARRADDSPSASMTSHDRLRGKALARRNPLGSWTVGSELTACMNVSPTVPAR